MSRSEQIKREYTYGETLMFGKFKGRPVSKDFIKDEINYFKWLVEENVCTFSNDIYYLIKKTPAKENPHKRDTRGNYCYDFGDNGAWDYYEWGV